MVGLPPRVIELAGAGGVLVATLAAGMVAHELTHALFLRTLDVPYDLEWFPGWDTPGLSGLGVHGSWATVTLRSIPPGTPTWGIRCAAIAPFVLATPLLLVLPDPASAGDPFITAATVAWLGCALPSPQDFSLFWHADRVIDGRRATSDAD